MIDGRYPPQFEKLYATIPSESNFTVITAQASRESSQRA